jgi:Skp family chaperone for outer membrane proteins
VKLSFFCLFTLSGLLVATSFGQSAAPGDFDAARQTIQKWAETQEIHAKEKKEWAEGKGLMEARLLLLESEIAQLEGKIAEAGKNMEDIAKREGEAARQQEEIKKQTELFGDTVGELEKQIQGLFAYIPESLQEKLKPLYRRIPEDPVTTKVSLAERFQNVLGILNEINRLNNEISLVSEIRNLPSGASAEVRTVYVGLAQAYYVSPKGDRAGIGRPAAKNWEWQEVNELAPNIREIIQILNNKATPKFVQLPLKIQ